MARRPSPTLSEARAALADARASLASLQDTRRAVCGSPELRGAVAAARKMVARAKAPCTKAKEREAKGRGKVRKATARRDNARTRLEERDAQRARERSRAKREREAEKWNVHFDQNDPDFAILEWARDHHRPQIKRALARSGGRTKIHEAIEEYARERRDELLNEITADAERRYLAEWQARHAADDDDIPF
jgi:hypothetical protein